MQQAEKLTGVILSGGRGRRMGGHDKGLVEFQGRPLIAHAISALRPVVDELLINANRNLEAYTTFGYPVVADASAAFDGPLAGILAALQHSAADVVLVMPCDSPLMSAEGLRRLVVARCQAGADVAVASDGGRWHPVFLAIHTTVRGDLQQFLATGQRKVEVWLRRHATVAVDFSDHPEWLVNLNTFIELDGLERH